MRIGGENIKKNCWEFNNCGREPNGAMVEEFGICPSSTKISLDRVHNGINANSCLSCSLMLS